MRPSKVNSDVLWERILSVDVKDSGCHSEFTGGKHGEKLHMERINRGSRLYKDIITAKAEIVRNRMRTRNDPVVIVGIAKGTNQSALDLADYLGYKTIGVETVKQKNRRSVSLTQAAKRVIMAVEPNLVVLEEDVSTAGTVCASVIPQLNSLGCFNNIVVPTIQRQPTLPKLDALGIETIPLIHEDLPTYTASQCQNIGYCALGVPLNPRQP